MTRETGSTRRVTSATKLLRSLRSVRRFSAQPIDDEVLLDILEVGRWTGSSKNSQPWEVVVIRDRSTLEQLSQLGQYAGHLAGAQVALALVMDSQANALDAGRLAQNVMLAAWAHGIGSCIGSLFPDENAQKAKALLGIPEEKWLRTAISLGYPADDLARFASRTPRPGSGPPNVGRKPMSAFASWGRYDRRTP
jgi:nitroreductase